MLLAVTPVLQYVPAMAASPASSHHPGLNLTRTRTLPLTLAITLEAPGRPVLANIHPRPPAEAALGVLCCTYKSGQEPGPGRASEPYPEPYPGSM